MKNILQFPSHKNFSILHGGVTQNFNLINVFKEKSDFEEVKMIYGVLCLSKKENNLIILLFFLVIFL